MLEQVGNLFEQKDTVIVICTDGWVNESGNAEPRSETASQASQIWPGLPSALGDNTRKEGSICQVVMTHYSSRVPLTVVSFPTKPGKIYLTNKKNLIKSAVPKGSSLSLYLPGAAAYSNLNIIRHSAEELVELTNKQKWDRVYLPRVGCGSGQLKWKAVKEIIAPILDDRFTILRLPRKTETKPKDDSIQQPNGPTLETGFLLVK